MNLRSVPNPNPYISCLLRLQHLLSAPELDAALRAADLRGIKFDEAAEIVRRSRR